MVCGKPYSKSPVAAIVSAGIDELPLLNFTAQNTVKTLCDSLYIKYSMNSPVSVLYVLTVWNRSCKLTLFSSIKSNPTLDASRLSL